MSSSGFLSKACDAFLEWVDLKFTLVLQLWALLRTEGAQQHSAHKSKTTFKPEGSGSVPLQLSSLTLDFYVVVWKLRNILRNLRKDNSRFIRFVNGKITDSYVTVTVSRQLQKQFKRFIGKLFIFIKQENMT